MRQAVWATTNAGTGRQATRRLDAGPQFAQRAKLSDCQKLVRVSGKAETDHATGRIQLKPRCFQQAKILHRDGKRISELLHLGAARIMDDARVCGCERSTKSPRREIGDHRAEFMHPGGPGKCATPCQCCRTDGVETETDVDGARRCTLIARRCCDVVDRLNGLEPQIEIEPYAGSKINALERAPDCIGFRREAVSVRSYCSGKFNREIGRAVCKIVAGLRIRGRRIRVVQALHD